MKQILIILFFLISGGYSKQRDILFFGAGFGVPNPFTIMLGLDLTNWLYIDGNRETFSNSSGISGNIRVIEKEDHSVYLSSGYRALYRYPSEVHNFTLGLDYIFGSIETYGLITSLDYLPTSKNETFDFKVKWFLSGW